MEQLPILAYEDRIVRTVLDNQVTVIAAETGAGKSTQVPLMLLNTLGTSGRIGITQPRRIAAMSVSGYVSELNGTELGTTIGYHIMGERRVTEATRVKFMTEGILLRELHSDPLLQNYEVVIVDEAHERGVNQDLILALLKRVMTARPDIKVVIMSATIDEQRFADYFGGAPVVKVPGRVFPVTVNYVEETLYGERIIEAAVDEVVSFVRSRRQGDILVFMPDEQAIKKTCAKIEDEKLDGCCILPLYGNQSPDEQREVFRRRTRERRIIVATNIAETSITIPGVVHVVDSCLIKAMQYVSASMSSLQVGFHSQAGCNQRAGRAGRTQPGTCVRLMTASEFSELPNYTEPEIRRMSLDAVFLHLRVLGYSTDEVKSFEFMDPPGAERWDEARERLVALGALDAEDAVTDDGKRMERLPIAPMLGRMVLTAAQYGCVEPVATIVAGLTAHPVFVRPRGKEDEAGACHARFKESASDALTLLKVCRAWVETGENGTRNEWTRENFLSSRALREIDRNRKQILEVLIAEGVEASESDDPALIRKAVAAGLIVNLCKFAGNHLYQWHETEGMYIHPGSSLFGAAEPRFMVCASVVQTTRTFARDCTAIDEGWLDELIPVERQRREYTIRVRPNYLGGIGTPTLIEKTSWHGLTLGERAITEIPDAAYPYIAAHLTGELVNPWNFEEFHPQTQENRIRWRAIQRVPGFSETVTENRKAFVQAICAAYREKIAGARTLAEIGERNLSMRFEAWLPEHVRAEFCAVFEEAEAEIAALKRDALADRERHAEAARSEAERRARREAATGPIRERIENMRLRITQLSSVVKNSWRLNGELYAAEDRLTYCPHEEVAALLDVVESKIRRHEEEQSEQFTLTEQSYERAVRCFPMCPVCDGEWQSVADGYVCKKKHDRAMMIPLDGGELDSEATLGEFKSNRDETVATLRDVSGTVCIRGILPRGRPWALKKFKSVDYVPRVSILPAHLVEERDRIIGDLAELRAARRELETVIARIKEIETRVGSGTLRKLTFRTIDGLAAAEDRGVIYQASFTGLYPEAGETWYCRIGHDVSTAGRRVVEVHPEFKVGSIASAASIDELTELIALTYPGLPPELLLH